MTKNLDKLNEKIKQLQNQKQAILNREKERMRKERNHRLILVGAEFERYLKITSLEQVKLLGQFLDSDKAFVRDFSDKFLRFVAEAQKKAPDTGASETAASIYPNSKGGTL